MDGYCGEEFDGTSEALTGHTEDVFSVCALGDGMDYFNTYGGSPVAAAVGLEVINVIEQEHLLARTEEVRNLDLMALFFCLKYPCAAWEVVLFFAGKPKN